MKEKVLLCKSSEVKTFLANQGSMVEGDPPAICADGQIVIDGFITEGGSTWYSVGTESIKNEIQKQLNDPNISSIFVKMNSPGGEVAGINELSDFIYQSKNIKPIICYSNGMIASAAYWVASACSKIYIDETCEIGSVGVVATIYDYEQFMKNEGIEVIEITNDDAPEKRLDYKKKENQEKLKKDINQIAEVFYKSVARNRGVNIETVKRDFGRGGMLIGHNAVLVGMADEIKNTGDKMGLFNKEELTLEGLKSDHPQLVNQIKKETETAEKSDILKAEHERQKAVLSVVGAEVPDCIFDDTDAKTLAFDIATKPEVKEKYQKFSFKKILEQRIQASDDGDFVPPVTADTETVKKEAEAEAEAKKAQERQNKKLGE